MTFNKGFMKAAGAMDFIKTPAVGHAAEVAGLGLLAVPSIQKLRNKPMKEHNAAKFDAAGLGVLAAPSIAHLISHK